MMMMNKGWKLWHSSETAQIYCRTLSLWFSNQLFFYKWLVSLLCHSDSVLSSVEGPGGFYNIHEDMPLSYEIWISTVCTLCKMKDKAGIVSLWPQDTNVIVSKALCVCLVLFKHLYTQTRLMIQDSHSFRKWKNIL